MSCKLCFAPTADEIEVFENVQKWAEVILKHINIIYIIPLKVCRDCSKKLNEIHDFCEFVKIRQLANDYNAAIKLEEIEEVTTEDTLIDPNNLKLEFTAEDEEFLTEQTDRHDIQEQNEVCEQAIGGIQDFEYDEDVNTFIKEHCQGNQLCKVCDKTYKDLRALKIHVVKNHIKRKFNCKECGIVFRSKRAVHRHASENHKKTTTANIRPAYLTCKVCQKTYKTKALLNNHKKQKHRLKYFCKSCDKGFLKLLSLELHLARDHKEDANDTNEEINERTCIICNKLYKNVSALRCHMSAIHRNETPYPCQSCSLQFKDYLAHRQHNEKVHSGVDKDGYKPEDRHCIICNIGYPRMQSYRLHMQMLHKGAFPFACLKCEKRFQTRPAFRRHMENMHANDERSDSNTKVHSTEAKVKDGDNFNENNDIKLVNEILVIDHENNSKGSYKKSTADASRKLQTDNVEDLLSKEPMETENIDCLNDNSSNTLISNPSTKTEATKAYTTKNNDTFTKAYVKFNSEGKPTCSICQKTWTSVSLLCAHIERDHIKTKRVCQFCSEEFYSHRHLLDHMRKEHKQKDHLFCESCQKSFKNSHALQIHISRIHQERHTCEPCGLTFPKKKNLAAHIARGHKEEENEANKDELHDRFCIICKKLYKNLGALRCHIQQIHRNEAAYQCTKCDLKCKDNFQLRRHYKKAHTKPDPYDECLCIICNVSFRNTSSLRCHMERTHNGVRPYSCDGCNVKFVLKTSYLRHINETCAKRRKWKRKAEQNKPNAIEDCTQIVPVQSAVNADATHEHESSPGVPALVYNCPGSCNLELNDYSHLRSHLSRVPEAAAVTNSSLVLNAENQTSTLDIFEITIKDEENSL